MNEETYLLTLRECLFYCKGKVDFMNEVEFKQIDNRIEEELQNISICNVCGFEFLDNRSLKECEHICKNGVTK